MTWKEPWKEHLRKGSLALAREDYPFAQNELSLALQEAKSTFDDQSRLGVIYGLLAQSFFKHANFERAEPLLKQAIALEIHDQTKTGIQAKTRDLICLSEILRKKGQTTEALACLDDAILTLGAPCVSDEISGSEEFDALKNLFASAQAHTAKAKTNSNPKARQFTKRTIKETETEETKTSTAVEQEFRQMVQLVIKLEARENREQAKLLSALLVLVQLGLKLGLTEQSEHFLKRAFSVAFGKSHGKNLSIPNGASAATLAAPTLVTSLLVTKADFYTHCYDFAAAAKSFADLMKWLENHEQSVDLINEPDASAFVESFIVLTQKSDLYASARLLIKQAIELEEYGDFLRAVSVYDKALAIFDQLFPHTHLEVAQVMQFKAAALASAGLNAEADDLEFQASLIEDEISARSSKAEMIAERLPEEIFY